MGNVIASQSISLDGYSAGVKAGRDNPLGDDGERLHEWLYGLDSWREAHNLEGGESNADAELLDELFANLGTVIMGRRATVPRPGVRARTRATGPGREARRHVVHVRA
jgi:hypothetical protein